MNNTLSKTYSWKMARFDSNRAYAGRGQAKQRIIRNGAEKAYRHAAGKLTSVLLVFGLVTGVSSFV